MIHPTVRQTVWTPVRAGPVGPHAPAVLVVAVELAADRAGRVLAVVDVHVEPARVGEDLLHLAGIEALTGFALGQAVSGLAALRERQVHLDRPVGARRALVDLSHAGHARGLVEVGD